MRFLVLPLLLACSPIDAPPGAWPPPPDRPTCFGAAYQADTMQELLAGRVTGHEFANSDPEVDCATERAWPYLSPSELLVQIHEPQASWLLQLPAPVFDEDRDLTTVVVQYNDYVGISGVARLSGNSFEQGSLLSLVVTGTFLSFTDPELALEASLHFTVE